MNLNEKEMTNLKRAIIAHFACNRVTLDCSPKLEENVNAAKSFMDGMQGIKNDGFDKLMNLSRYRTKKKLIERYLNNLES